MADSFPEPQRRLYKKVAACVVEVKNLKKGNIGTGTVVSHDGLVVTAHHVIAGTTKNGGQKICHVNRLFLPDDSFEPVKKGCYVAHVVFMDRDADIAVLRIRRPPKRLGIATIGDSSTLNIDDDLYKVGRSDNYPLATGAITAIGPEITVSMRAQSGDSGGPLFDGDGIVVAMLQCVPRTRKRPRAFAMPINEVLRRIRKNYEIRVTLENYVPRR